MPAVFNYMKRQEGKNLRSVEDEATAKGTTNVGDGRDVEFPYAFWSSPAQLAPTSNKKVIVLFIRL
jgi:hypothetical protein